jgi:hypothetical protein
MRSGVRLSHPVVALLAAGFWLSVAGPAWAAPITYNEGVGGELAGQSIGTFDIGANTVTASETTQSGVSFDAFLFTVAAGQQLDGIVLTSLSSVGVQGFTLAPPGPLDLSTRYGFLLLGSSNVGSDFLPLLLQSDPGKTATAPLPAGTYQVFVGSSASSNYEYTFNVSAAKPVPEPGALALMGIGLVGVAFRWRRTLSATGFRAPAGSE